MTTLYALMVGIDDYPPELGPLRGCRNDITAAATVLRARQAAGTVLRLRMLLDGNATREAIIAGFREHLGRAGPRDTALFWFSGHGSTVGTPPALWPVDPSGRSRSLVCADSRRDGVPDLLHRELGLLVAEVAAGGGHVVVVLDCGTAGAPDRDPTRRTRVAPRLGAPPAAEALLPELRRPVPEARGRLSVDLDLLDDHVELAACGAVGGAREVAVGGADGPYHGLFTWALVNAIARLGSSATYRQVLTAARCQVEDLARDQIPQVLPADGDLADQAFLGGRVLAPAPPRVMRLGPEGWEINAGAADGLAGASLVAVRGSDPAREARVQAIHATRSTVTPLGWRPDPAATYPVVLSETPFADTVVAVDGEPTLARMRAAVYAGVPGEASPPLRFIAAERTAAPELRVAAPDADTLRVLSADGFILAEDHRGDHGDGARWTVAALEHIVHWRRLKAFTNPLSTVGNVAIEVVPAVPGDVVAPHLRPALRRDASGAVRLAYRSAAAWSAPTAFVRLRNHTDQRLYGVLLTLTDGFAASVDLFPGDHLEPGATAVARGGRPVRFGLPSGRPPSPGTSTTGWLKLIVAERPFDPETLTLPGLEDSAGWGSPPAGWGPRELFHSSGVAAPPDWTTTTLPVVTTVPR